jgi:hypothetical protein
METRSTAFLRTGLRLEDSVTAEAVQLLVMAFPMINADVERLALEQPKDSFPGMLRDGVRSFLLKVGVDEQHLKLYESSGSGSSFASQTERRLNSVGRGVPMPEQIEQSTDEKPISIAISERPISIAITEVA